MAPFSSFSRSRRAVARPIATPRRHWSLSGPQICYRIGKLLIHRNNRGSAQIGSVICPKRDVQLSRQCLPISTAAERPLTPRQKEILDYIVLTGESPYVAAERLRTAPSNIYRVLRYPHVKKELQQCVLDHVSVLSLYASRCQEELLRSDSDHVRVTVAQDILNRHLGKPIARQDVAIQGTICVTIDLS